MHGSFITINRLLISVIVDWIYHFAFLFFFFKNLSKSYSAVLHQFGLETKICSLL